MSNVKQTGAPAVDKLGAALRQFPDDLHEVAGLCLPPLQGVLGRLQALALVRSVLLQCHCGKC